MSLPTLQSVFSSVQIDIIQQWINQQIELKFPNGNVTMTSGTATVAFTSITANSRVVVSPEFETQGVYYVTVTAGVGFVITSSNILDAGDFFYIIKQD